MRSKFLQGVIIFHLIDQEEFKTGPSCLMDHREMSESSYLFTEFSIC